MAGAAFDDFLDRSNLTGRQFLIYTGQRLHPGVALYNSVYAIGWPDLDPARFRSAWQAVLDSCDALRIVIDEVDGVPQQRVLPAFHAAIDCIDLDGKAEPRREIDEWVEQRLQRPIVLSERVFDTALLRTADGEYVWFLHVHHVVADGAALQILFRQICEHYLQPVQGNLAAAPQFGNRLSQVSALRCSQSYIEARAHWTEVLRQPIDTPKFYGADASATTSQERVVLSLDAATGLALATLARTLATPAMSEHAAAANLFKAIFAAYLCRVGGSEQVSIGVTFHNRSGEQRNVVGLFMEVIPIAVRVSWEDSLVTLMRRVTDAVAAALKHRDYSVGHSARAPAFSALFNYMRALAKPAIPLNVRRIHPGHGSNALSLSIEPQDGTYNLWFDVNVAVAATSSARRLGEHLVTLLRSAVLHPEQPLAQMSLLSVAEESEVRAACNGPAVPAQVIGGCARRFETRAALTPEATALSFGTFQLTYAGLNRSANRLAHSLRALGAKRGRRVAICLERSPEMVTAVLAVLKSGAAYVPLDPAYPQSRLKAMLGDCAPVVLITTGAICVSLPPHAAHLVLMDQEAANFAVTGSNDNPNVTIAPDDTAYVIYTSGTTGTPKGALVPHGSVANHLAWRSTYFPVGPTDRCLQTASLSFDDSVWEILEPLSCGAAIVLARPRFEYDSAYLATLIVEQRVSIACFVPSLLRAVIEQPGISQCVSLRRLTTGGEGLSVPLMRRVLERLPHVQFYNGYGTTEATIASLYWKCEATSPLTSVPIGRPIANTQVYILDRAAQLVPPGVMGEIYIGGLGVGAGYLNRPELTAACFIDDRLGSDTGRKLYRTGDSGRLRADGLFEFAGRVDEQVKIRGVRFELGDIEAALLEHPQIAAAVVVCGETAAGTALTAYVVQRSTGPIAQAELRAFVRDRLPAAVVPNRFESIATLPLTPNGKVDRRSLPILGAAEPLNQFVAPRNDLEKRLVGLWEEVLAARPIGIHDDFFELGGHSLSAVQVAASLQRVVGKALSPGLLFECPTIELLSARVGGFSEGTKRNALVPLTPHLSGPPLFLAHHVSGDITSYRDLARYLGGSRTVYGIRAPELDTDLTPLDRIEAMAARYLEEIRAMQPHGPYLLGGHSAGAHIAFEMARQLRAAGEPVALLAILEADARTRTRQRSFADTLRSRFETLRRLPAGQRGVYLWRRFLCRVVGPSRTGVAFGESGQDGTMNAVWRAMERAVYAYRPEPYPGLVTLFRATDRSVTGTYSRTLGWGRLAQAGVRIIDVPGSHATVLRPGSEPPMAAKLRACLEELAAQDETGVQTGPELTCAVDSGAAID